MPDDDIQEGSPQRPKKRKAPPPEDDEDDRPRRRRRDAEEESAEDLGASPLSAVVPIGGSVWALLSFYLALLSCIVPIPLLGLIAILLGLVAFFTHKHKASYGSVTGNMRAILGILIGFITMVGTTIGWVMFMTGNLK